MPSIPNQDDFVTIVKKLGERIAILEQKQFDNQVILADKKIYLDGNTMSTYIVWNSGASQLEFYVNNTLEGFISSSNTGARLANV